MAEKPILSDGDVLKIFANDGFYTSTAVYRDAQTCVGISTFAEGGVEYCKFESVKLWEDLTLVQRVSTSNIASCLPHKRELKEQS